MAHGTTLRPHSPTPCPDPPLDSFDEDVHTIHEAVSQLSSLGKDVLVVMHSYGAVPGTEAMRSLAKAERQ